MGKDACMVYLPIMSRDLYIGFVCEECGEKCRWPADGLKDNGTPVCVECQIDMEVDETSFLYLRSGSS